jgi:hypothetical protein
MLVDDFKVQKKHVNIYEPVQFYSADFKAPVELVINRISKNRAEVQGRRSGSESQSGPNRKLLQNSGFQAPDLVAARLSTTFRDRLWIKHTASRVSNHSSSAWQCYVAHFSSISRHARPTVGR